MLEIEDLRSRISDQGFKSAFYHTVKLNGDHDGDGVGEGTRV